MKVLAVPVLLQALNFEALGLYQLKEFKAAATTYLEIVENCTGTDHLFSKFEALRLAAHCLHRTGDNRAAWTTGLQALDTAETLPHEIIQRSTIEYLRDEMTELAEKLNLPQDLSSVQRRVVALVAGSG